MTNIESPIFCPLTYYNFAYLSAVFKQVKFQFLPTASAALCSWPPVCFKKKKEIMEINSFTPKVLNVMQCDLGKANTHLFQTYCSYVPTS